MFVSDVDAVRAFNRFYTRRIGALGEHLLDSPYSLTEMRVLYELAHRAEPTATDIAAALGLDAGYLSRILAKFEHRRLIARITATADARRSLVRLTAAGRTFFAPFEQRARGLGIGRRLAEESIRFARQAGYRTITLWTHSQLTAARRIYRQCGFKCVQRRAVRSFGKRLIDETWELALTTEEA